MIPYNKCKVYTKMERDSIYGKFFLTLFRLKVMFNLQDH